MKSLALTQARHSLAQRSSDSRKSSNERFFKSARGQYGFGDRFLGVTVPETRQVARHFSHLVFADLKLLLKSKWHEERLLALMVLSTQFERGEALQQKQVFDFLLKHLDRVNNWDLVDTAAPSIVGPWTHHTKQERRLVKWAASSKLWERRVAMVSTLAWIRRGDCGVTFRIARLLLGDSEDLIHKASGWMLREAGKKNPKLLLAFLDKYAVMMPRTMLRYSLERLSPSLRKHYMSLDSKVLRKGSK